MENSALIPTPNVQLDNYDWTERRRLKLQQVASGRHDLIFIDDSITHRFEREDGGLKWWNHFYGHRRALNLGYGWDCTQNVLWRLQNGEFAGLSPRLVVLNIGTNNLTGNDVCRPNTAEEIVAGIEAIAELIHSQSPETAIILMGVFPRGLSHEPIHAKVRELNAALKTAFASRPRFIFQDIGGLWLGTDCEIPIDLMADRCHPNPES